MFTRRTFAIAFSILPFVPLLPGAAWAQGAQLSGDTVETSGGPVTLHPVSHASFLIGFGANVIYVDPVGGAEAYRDLPRPTAILITHGHSDHFDLPTLEAIGAEVPLLVSAAVFELLPAGLKSRAKAIGNGESGTLLDIPVEAIGAYNTTADRLQFHPKGVGNGYVLTFSDKRIYVAGDTEDVPEMRALTDIEVAFLPMNLPYTMTVEQAADAVKAFKPRIVYPYHSRGSDLEAFAGRVGDASEVRIRNWYPSA